MGSRNKKTPLQRKFQARMMRFAHEQNLMPWSQVHDRWNAMSGQNITRARVWRIASRAEEKLRDAMDDSRRRS